VWVNRNQTFYIIGDGNLNLKYTDVKVHYSLDNSTSNTLSISRSELTIFSLSAGKLHSSFIPEMTKRNATTIFS